MESNKFKEIFGNELFLSYIDSEECRKRMFITDISENCKYLEKFVGDNQAALKCINGIIESCRTLMISAVSAPIVKESFSECPISSEWLFADEFLLNIAEKCNLKLEDKCKFKVKADENICFKINKGTFQFLFLNIIRIYVQNGARSILLSCVSKKDKIIFDVSVRIKRELLISEEERESDFWEENFNYVNEAVAKKIGVDIDVIADGMSIIIDEPNYKEEKIMRSKKLINDDGDFSPFNIMLSNL